MNIPISEKHGVNPSIVVCFWCGKETNEIALLGRLPNDAEAPRHVVINYEPCEECAGLMSQGITLMEADPYDKKPTGRWLVVKEEAVLRIIQPTKLAWKIMAKRKAYISKDVFNLLTEHAE